MDRHQEEEELVHTEDCTEHKEDRISDYTTRRKKTPTNEAFDRMPKGLRINRMKTDEEEDIDD